VQAHYGVLNPGESWRTGLMAIAHGAFHSLRSRARERLHLSCGLRGNGWCVTARTLRRVPYSAYSVTEDLEYGIALGLAGERVHYAEDAQVAAVMESAEGIARRQRLRWEDGRFDLIRSKVLPLLRKALRKRSRVCLDLALDLALLPLSYVALQVAALGVLAMIAAFLQPSLLPWVWVAVFSAGCLLCYVLRGWQLSGRGLAGFGDLLHVPYYLLWKLRLLLSRHDRHQWVPTQRREP
jgi:cellulose synthase/poly-beta-1,6-N-acetylglucosamine synthase-like glycosyltransferase